MLQKALLISLILLSTLRSRSQDTTSLDDWKWEVDAGLPFIAWYPYQFYNNVPRLFLTSARYQFNEQWRARLGVFGGESYYDGYSLFNEWEKTGFYGFDASFEGVIWKTNRLAVMYYGGLMYFYAEVTRQSKSKPNDQVYYDNGYFIGIAGGSSVQYTITPHFIATIELGVALGPYYSNRYIASCNCVKFRPEFEIAPSRWPSLTLGYRF